MSANRAYPAGVEVEDLRVKITPPANNSIRGRAVMCFYLLSVGLGMWAHIDLFLTRLGFCHTITSLLKTEARLGGSFTIPLFQIFSKNPQKKFAFSLFGGIVTSKSLKSLSIAGGNKAPTNNHIYPDFWAVSGVYSGVTIDTISTQPPFFRALKCAEKDTKKSFSIGGNKCTAHLPQRNSGRTKPAPNEPSKWLTKTTPMSLLMTPPLSLKCSSTGSTMVSKKSTRSGWKNGRKPFKQSRRRIGENHCLYSVLAFADRPDRGFYRPCKMMKHSRMLYATLADEKNLTELPLRLVILEKRSFDYA